MVAMVSLSPRWLRRTLFCAALAALLVAALAAAADSPEPRFTETKELVRPEGYREWVFVGSSLGMSYQEGQPRRDPKFHNIYLKPSVYQHFRKTGEFPEGAILVMEVATAASQSSINRHGQFQDSFVGIEAAVKDSSRFAEKWAYFSFIGEDGPPKKTAKAFPQDACWKCHNEHASTDNVFTQFYPVLRHGE
jgi:hypothetical protein